MALTDYVLMPRADYVGMCDKMREIKETSSTFTSGQLLEEFNSFDGKSAELRYITFKSENGTEEYGIKPVAVGDDCADPIARGLFNKPTKESTEQYIYTFDGWATAANGNADSSALKAVNEDRTVYAAFTASTRQYTVRFFDGDTLVGTPQTVVYGETVTPPTIEKQGYDLYWQPASFVITADTDFYTDWQEKAVPWGVVPLSNYLTSDTGTKKTFTLNDGWYWTKGTAYIATFIEGAEWNYYGTVSELDESHKVFKIDDITEEATGFNFTCKWNYTASNQSNYTTDGDESYYRFYDAEGKHISKVSKKNSGRLAAGTQTRTNTVTGTFPANAAYMAVSVALSGAVDANMSAADADLVITVNY